MMTTADIPWVGRNDTAIVRKKEKPCIEPMSFFVSSFQFILAAVIADFPVERSLDSS